ncbi:replication restart helicase PriA [Limisphaera sp. VF-2]|uniref:replication restart helicase PriA n=1 Tax=Limisphaera sp. VF-2 TaxID=3400418 RepID=UPI001768DB3B
MIARVTLELALGREFDYAVPDEWAGQVAVGSRVEVPLGRRKVLGIVTDLAEASGQVHLKPILRVVGGQALVTPVLLRLARWMAEYYCCPPELALRSVLPEAVRRPEAGWRQRLQVRMVPAQGPLPKLPKRQREVWHVVEERRCLPLTELLELTGASLSTVRRLEDKGLVEIVPQVEERDPYGREQILPTEPLPLNEAQRRALAAIREALDRLCGLQLKPSEESEAREPSAAGAGKEGAALSRTFLLHGVTGSGKTEVYLQAMAAALERGRGAIVLVPEIALTPQTVERFKARFSSGPHRTLVAVLHSHLSAGERHDEWHKIRQGRARIVIGARSAVFAPVQNLGLIIVDEEHEPTYKQEEAPRYHARDVAVLRGQMEGAVVVLGSATPSLESYWNARRGKYRLLVLPERVDQQKMPRVRVVDMRQAARAERGVPVFSPQLREAILQRLEKREQVILFLNRRGYATALQCPRCGYVAQCPNCSVALTYHRAGQHLLCHICGERRPAPSACPNETCRDPAIRYAGLGTQRVEEALQRQFPRARVQRMDSDTLKRKEDYRRILAEFRAGRIDILVGTQMIAKGLHFPNVTLVGIVHADLALHQPDFRAAERTFQLLTQVAGRAGRGEVEGEVIIQSFTPYHPAIQYARRHDFEGFYEQEMEFRAQLEYPPLTRVALVTLRGRNEDKVRFVAEHVRRDLSRRLEGFSELKMTGPAPAPLERAQTYYRYHLMLRTRRMPALSRELGAWLKETTLPEDVHLTVDVDPVSLL